MNASYADQLILVEQLIGSVENVSTYAYGISLDWWKKWCTLIGLPESLQLKFVKNIDTFQKISSKNIVPSSTSKSTVSTVRSSSVGSQRKRHDSNSPLASRRSNSDDHVVPKSFSKDSKPLSISNHGQNQQSSKGSLVNVSNKCAQQQEISCTKLEPNLEAICFDTSGNNVFVDERLFVLLVKWFGLDGTHYLDRIHSSFGNATRTYEIGVLSPYCGLIDNPRRSFPNHELVGFVEIQLRRIFKVDRQEYSRVWVCEKSRHSRFTLLMQRHQTLQQSIFSGSTSDTSKGFILALEISEVSGSWPSKVSGDPIGSLYSLLPSQQHIFLSISHIPNSQQLQVELWRLADGANESMRHSIQFLLKQLNNYNHLKDDVSNKNDLISKKSYKQCYQDEQNTQVTANVNHITTQISELKLLKDNVQAQIKELLDKQNEMERLKNELEEQRIRLEDDKQALNEERNSFAEELVRMHTLHVIQEGRVRINVGGHLFTTSTLTLKKNPHSLLAQMFSGRHAMSQHQDGTYFIDRDGTYFRHILNFLRDGCITTLPKDIQILTHLTIEANYYNLPDLVEAIYQIMQNPMNKSNQL